MLLPGPNGWAREFDPSRPQSQQQRCMTRVCRELREKVQYCDTGLSVPRVAFRRAGGPSRGQPRGSTRARSVGAPFERERVARRRPARGKRRFIGPGSYDVTSELRASVAAKAATAGASSCRRTLLGRLVDRKPHAFEFLMVPRLECAFASSSLLSRRTEAARGRWPWSRPVSRVNGAMVAKSVWPVSPVVKTDVLLNSCHNP